MAGTIVKFFSLFCFFMIAGCQNGKVTHIFPYQIWTDVVVVAESSYCFPNTLVLVGQEKDTSTAYWYGEKPAEGYELVRMITLLQDSIRLYSEQTYFNGNPEKFALNTEKLKDTVVVDDGNGYKTFYKELLAYRGVVNAKLNDPPVYGKENDTRKLYVMRDSLCKVVTLYKESEKNEKGNKFGNSYKVVVDFFSRFEQMFGDVK